MDTLTGQSYNYSIDKVRGVTMAEKKRNKKKFYSMILSFAIHTNRVDTISVFGWYFPLHVFLP